MTHITRDDVLKLAQLSSIKLSEEEINKFVAELDEIVKYVEQIDSIDTKGLQPTDQVTGLSNVMRPDEVVEYQSSPKSLQKNLPKSEGEYIKVKRVL